MTGRGDQPERPEPEAAGTPALEWVVAAVGATTLAGVVGFLVWAGFAERDGTPDVVVVVETVEPVSGGHRVSFVALNQGEATAAAVRVRGEIAGPDGETSWAQIEHLPHGGERRGALIFSRAPEPGTLRLRVEGWVDP